MLFITFQLQDGIQIDIQLPLTKYAEICDFWELKRKQLQYSRKCYYLLM